MALSEEELQNITDEAAGYYFGLWTLLRNSNAPTELIINAAVNNALGVMDHYMPGDDKVALLEKIIETIKTEEANATEIMQ
jgi:hypothetical protein